MLSFVQQAESIYLAQGLVTQLGNLFAENSAPRLVELRKRFRAALAYCVVLEAAPFCR